MKVDAGLSADMSSIAAQVSRLEKLGYDGVRLAELNHDPFLPLTLAAEHSTTLDLITSVAVAFARNPMSMASISHDLNAFSNGRLVLGLGSQVRPHIERRFSMPWYKGARQMREFIEAMHAIFDCWYDGVRLEFIGEYYEHTLMPATFTPDNLDAGRPRINLSATGPLMTRVAAEVADGMIMHPFSSEKYIREVTLPAIETGLSNSNRTLDDFELDYAPIIATGADEESLVHSIEIARDRIAFYGSTEAYRPVLDIHGWGELQVELSMLNKRREQKEMSRLITDEILNTIAIVGTPNDVVVAMKDRLGEVIDRTGFHVSSLPDEEQMELIAKLKS
jgi:probable F420-dependent oxidoreductase